MKPLVAALAAALAACSLEEQGARTLDAGDDADAAGELADAAADVDAGRALCAPVLPPSVCLAYEVDNPSDPRAFAEYPLACAPPRDGCFVYSLDPSRFTPTTWATCCPSR